MAPLLQKPRNDGGISGHRCARRRTDAEAESLGKLFMLKGPLSLRGNWSDLSGKQTVPIRLNVCRLFRRSIVHGLWMNEARGAVGVERQLGAVTGSGNAALTSSGPRARRYRSFRSAGRAAVGGTADGCCSRVWHRSCRMTAESQKGCSGAPAAASSPHRGARARGRESRSTNRVIVPAAHPHSEGGASFAASAHRGTGADGPGSPIRREGRSPT